MACMFCTKCGGCELGRMSDAGEGSCMVCGAQLAAEDTACAQCGAPVLKMAAPGQFTL